MAVLDFDSLISEVEKKGSIINAPNSLLVINTSPKGDGTPYVEFKN